MRIALYPHNPGSAGARRLRDALVSRGHRAKIVFQDGVFNPARFTQRDLILGWGNSSMPNWSRRFTENCRWINRPNAIGQATNKLLTFQVLQNARVPIPDFTTEQEVARTWIGQGRVVIGRRTLQGARGEGIIIARTAEEVTSCPLYTKWKSADREYRVYVVGNRVVDYLQKKRPNGAGDLGIIRSAANGWVYCRTDIRPLPDPAADAAVAACGALNLEFGGVDILWGNKTGARVLEVNTAPGIDGQGVTIIASALLATYGEHQNAV